MYFNHKVTLKISLLSRFYLKLFILISLFLHCEQSTFFQKNYDILKYFYPLYDEIVYNILQQITVTWNILVKFTPQQIDTLAPDAPSIKAGQKIFTKTAWMVERSERAIWTQIQGSGKNPYYTQIDNINTAFKCSCPSRKFPCKHGLALGYYLASTKFETITLKDEPEWVKEWIDKRSSKEADKTPAKPKSQESIEKTVNRKWENAIKDIEYLEMWLEDTINQGLLDFPDKDYYHFSKIKKSFVDKKLSGINRFFSMLETIDYEEETWKEEVLTILSSLHLLVKCIKNHNNLEKKFKQELSFLLGWSVPQKELLASKTATQVDDVWFIVGVQKWEEEKMTARKVHLYGITSNKTAYILEFSFGGSFTTFYTIGSPIEAKLLFFEGVLEQRAIVKVQGQNTSKTPTLKPLKSLDEAQNIYIKEKIIYPFLFDKLHFTEELHITKQTIENTEVFILIDTNKTFVIVDITHTRYLTILAYTKGEKFSVFLVQQSQNYTILSVYYENKVIGV